MYYHRDIEKTMLEKSKDFQALAIYGSRQIGKSTTIRETFGDRFSYVTLDDADNAELASSKTIYPIEIKKGITPSKPNKNFNVLSKYNLNIKPGLVIDNCEKIFPINQNAYYFPVSYLGA